MAGNSVQYKIQIQADASQAQRSVEQLNQSLTRLRTISQQQIHLNLDYRDAAQQAEKLQNVLQKAVNIDTGKIDFRQLTAGLQGANTNVQTLMQSFSKAGQSGQQAMRQLNQALTQATVPAQKATGIMAKFGTTLMNTFKWQIASNMIHGMQSAITNAVSYVEQLNKSLTDIRIVTGKSIGDMTQFAQQANKMARTLSTSTKAYADAALIYYQQGDTDKLAQQKANITLKATNAAFKANAQEMSQMLTAVWNSYKASGDQLESYVDIMAKLGATTATSMEEIATSLQKVAATANTVGVSMNQMSSIVATVSSVTRESAEHIGTSFKTILARMGDLKLGNTLEDGVGLGKVSSTLKSVGVSVLDATGQMRDMGDVITELGNKWQSLNKAQKTAIAEVVGGKRQYTQLMALFENWDEYNKNLANTKDSNGALNKMQKTYESSIKAAKARLQASKENLWGTLIDDQNLVKFNDSLAKTLDVVTNIVKGLGGLPGILAGVGNAMMHAFQPQLLQKMTNAFTAIGSMPRQAWNAIRGVGSYGAYNRSFQAVGWYNPNTVALGDKMAGTRLHGLQSQLYNDLTASRMHIARDMNATLMRGGVIQRNATTGYYENTMMNNQPISARPVTTAQLAEAAQSSKYAMTDADVAHYQSQQNAMYANNLKTAQMLQQGKLSMGQQAQLSHMQEAFAKRSSDFAALEEQMLQTNRNIRTSTSAATLSGQMQQQGFGQGPLNEAYFRQVARDTRGTYGNGTEAYQWKDMTGTSRANLGQHIGGANSWFNQYQAQGSAAGRNQVLTNLGNSVIANESAIGIQRQAGQVLASGAFANVQTGAELSKLMQKEFSPEAGAMSAKALFGEDWASKCAAATTPQEVQDLVKGFQQRVETEANKLNSEGAGARTAAHVLFGQRGLEDLQNRGREQAGNVAQGRNLNAEQLNLDPPKATAAEKLAAGMKKVGSAALAAAQGFNQMKYILQSLDQGDTAGAITSIATAAGSLATTFATQGPWAGLAQAAAMGVQYAITAINKSSEELKKRQKEQAENANRMMKEAKEQNTSLKNTYETWQDLNQQYQNGEISFSSYQEQIQTVTDALELQADVVQRLSGSYEGLNEELESVYFEKLKEAQTDTEDAYLAYNNSVVSRATNLDTEFNHFRIESGKANTDGGWGVGDGSVRWRGMRHADSTDEVNALFDNNSDVIRVVSLFADMKDQVSGIDSIEEAASIGLRFFGGDKGIFASKAYSAGDNIQANTNGDYNFADLYLGQDMDDMLDMYERLYSASRDNWETFHENYSDVSYEDFKAIKSWIQNGGGKEFLSFLKDMTSGYKEAKKENEYAAGRVTVYGQRAEYRARIEQGGENIYDEIMEEILTAVYGQAGEGGWTTEQKQVGAQLMAEITAGITAGAKEELDRSKVRSQVIDKLTEKTGWSRDRVAAAVTASGLSNEELGYVDINMVDISDDAALSGSLANTARWRTARTKATARVSLADDLDTQLANGTLDVRQWLTDHIGQLLTGDALNEANEILKYGSDVEVAQLFKDIRNNELNPALIQSYADQANGLIDTFDGMATKVATSSLNSTTQGQVYKLEEDNIEALIGVYEALGHGYNELSDLVTNTPDQELGEALAAYWTNLLRTYFSDDNLITAFRAAAEEAGLDPDDIFTVDGGGQFRLNGNLTDTDLLALLSTKALNSTEGTRLLHTYTDANGQERRRFGWFNENLYTDTSMEALASADSTLRAYGRAGLTTPTTQKTEKTLAREERASARTNFTALKEMKTDLTTWDSTDIIKYEEIFGKSYSELLMMSAEQLNELVLEAMEREFTRLQNSGASQEELSQMRVGIDTQRKTIQTAVEKKNEAVLSAQETKWSEITTAATSAEEALSSFMSAADQPLTFSAIETLRQNLIDAGVAAEKVEEIIKSLTSDKSTTREKIDAAAMAAGDMALAKITALTEEQSLYDLSGKTPQASSFLSKQQEETVPLQGSLTVTDIIWGDQSIVDRVFEINGQVVFQNDDGTLSQLQNFVDQKDGTPIKYYMQLVNPETGEADPNHGYFLDINHLVTGAEDMGDGSLGYKLYYSMEPWTDSNGSGSNKENNPLLDLTAQLPYDDQSGKHKFDIAFNVDTPSEESIQAMEEINSHISTISGQSVTQAYTATITLSDNIDTQLASMERAIGLFNALQTDEAQSFMDAHGNTLGFAFDMTAGEGTAQQLMSMWDLAHVLKDNEWQQQDIPLSFELKAQISNAKGQQELWDMITHKPVSEGQTPEGINSVYINVIPQPNDPNNLLTTKEFEEGNKTVKIHVEAAEGSEEAYKLLFGESKEEFDLYGHSAEEEEARLAAEAEERRIQAEQEKLLALRAAEETALRQEEEDRRLAAEDTDTLSGWNPETTPIHGSFSPEAIAILNRAGPIETKEDALAFLQSLSPTERSILFNQSNFGLGAEAPMLTAGHSIRESGGWAFDSREEAENAVLWDAIEEMRENNGIDSWMDVYGDVAASLLFPTVAGPVKTAGAVNLTDWKDSNSIGGTSSDAKMAAIRGGEMENADGGVLYRRMLAAGIDMRKHKSDMGYYRPFGDNESMYFYADPGMSYTGYGVVTSARDLSISGWDNNTSGIDWNPWFEHLRSTKQLNKAGALAEVGEYAETLQQMTDLFNPDNLSKAIDENTLYDTLQPMFAKAMEWAQSPDGDIQQIGVYLLQGIVKGIQDNTDIIGEFSLAGCGLDDAIWQAFCAVFQIHSPSRLTRGLGVYLLQGLQVGLTENVGTFKPDLGNLSGIIYDALTKDIDDALKQVNGKYSKTKLDLTHLGIDIDPSTLMSEAGWTHLDEKYQAALLSEYGGYTSRMDANLVSDNATQEDWERAYIERYGSLTAGPGMDEFKSHHISIDTLTDEYMTQHADEFEEEYFQWYLKNKIDMSHGTTLDYARASATANTQVHDEWLAQKREQIRFDMTQSRAIQTNDYTTLFEQVNQDNLDLTKQWMREGYKNSESLSTDLAQATFASIRDKVLAEFGYSSIDDVKDADELTKIISRVADTYDTQWTNIQNTIDSTVASLQDTWKNGLDQLVELDAQEAQQVYTTWLNTFNAIAAARKAILGDKVIADEISDLSQLADIAGALYARGYNDTEVLDFLTSQQDRDKIGELWQQDNSGAWKQTSDYRYFYNEDGTRKANTSYADYEQWHHEQYAQYAEKPYEWAQNQFTQVGELTDETARLTGYESLIKLFKLDPEQFQAKGNGIYSVAEDKILTWDELKPLITSIEEIVTAAENQTKWTSGEWVQHRNEAAGQEAATFAARKSAEVDTMTAWLDKQSADLEKINAARDKGAGNLTEPERREIFDIMKKWGMVAEDQDFDTWTLTNDKLRSAGDSLVTTLASIAQQLKAVLGMILDGTADGWRIDTTTGEVVATKTTAFKAGMLSEDERKKILHYSDAHPETNTSYGTMRGQTYIAGDTSRWVDAGYGVQAVDTSNWSEADWNAYKADLASNLYHAGLQEGAPITMEMANAQAEQMISNGIYTAFSRADVKTEFGKAIDGTKLDEYEHADEKEYAARATNAISKGGWSDAESMKKEAKSRAAWNGVTLTDEDFDSSGEQEFWALATAEAKERSEAAKELQGYGGKSGLLANLTTDSKLKYMTDEEQYTGWDQIAQSANKFFGTDVADANWASAHAEELKKLVSGGKDAEAAMTSLRASLVALAAEKYNIDINTDEAKKTLGDLEATGKRLKFGQRLDAEGIKAVKGLLKLTNGSEEATEALAELNNVKVDVFDSSAGDLVEKYGLEEATELAHDLGMELKGNAEEGYQFSRSMQSAAEAITWTDDNSGFDFNKGGALQQLQAMADAGDQNAQMMIDLIVTNPEAVEAILDQKGEITFHVNDPEYEIVDVPLGSSDSDSSVSGAVKVTAGGVTDDATIEGDVTSSSDATAKMIKGTGGGGGGTPPPNKTGGGGGGQKKQKKKSKADIKRYHEVDKQIEHYDRSTAKLEAKESMAFGSDRVKLMAQRMKELNKQMDEYQEKLNEAAAYEKKDKANLQEAANELGFTFEFDENGTITNWEQWQEKLIEWYNEHKDDEAEEGMESAEDIYKRLQQLSEDYEDSVKTREEMEQKILEALHAQSELYAEMIEEAHKWKTDLQDLEMDLLEGQLNRMDDTLGNMGEKAKLMSEALFGADGTGLDGVGIQKLEELQAKYNEIASAATDEESIKNGTGMDEATKAEKLQEVMKEINTQMNDLWQKGQQIQQLYGQMWEKYDQELQNNLKFLENNVQMCGALVKVLELAGKSTAYDKLDEYYRKQLEYSNKQVDAYMSARETIAAEKARFDEEITAAGGFDNLDKQRQEDYKALLARIQETEANIVNATQGVLEAAAAIYQNAVNKAIDELDETLSMGMGDLEYLQSQYDRYTEVQDRYLNTAHQLYNVNKLNRQIEGAMADTNSKALRDQYEQLQNVINEKAKSGKLTQYDVDMMQKQYELLEKQAALRDAENAKDTVRLTRDENGNYMYQYTADQDKIDEATQAYDDVLIQINELSTQRVSELESEMLAKRKWYVEQARAIAEDETLTEEEKQERLTELRRQAAEDDLYFQEQMGIAYENLQINNSACVAHFGDAVDQAFNDPSEGINPTIQAAIENEENMATALGDAIDYIIPKLQELGRIQDQTLNRTGLEDPAEYFDTMSETTELAVSETNKLNETLATEAEQINAVTQEWYKQKQVLQDLFSTIEQANTENLQLLWQLGNNDAEASTPAPDGTIQYHLVPVRSSSTHSTDGGADGGTPTGYSTGGISRKTELAVLHGSTTDPELVLNADDTRNVLQAVAMAKFSDEEMVAVAKKLQIALTGGGYGGNEYDKIDTLINTGVFDQLLQQIVGQAYAMSYGQLIPGGTPILGPQSGITQEIVINADFPNATDAEEIQKAFEELTNRAAQYVNNIRNK